MLCSKKKVSYIFVFSFEGRFVQRVSECVSVCVWTNCVYIVTLRVFRLENFLHILKENVPLRDLLTFLFCAHVARVAVMQPLVWRVFFFLFVFGVLNFNVRSVSFVSSYVYLSVWYLNHLQVLSNKVCVLSMCVCVPHVFTQCICISG